MSIFTMLCPVVAIGLAAWSARCMFKLAESQVELGEERSLRTGCQLQLESRDKTIRSLSDDLRRSQNYESIDLKNANETKRQLQEDLREARKDSRDAKNMLSDYLLSDILSIKFTANIPQKGWTKTEFKLGVGSCGKEVTALHWTEKDDRYELRQTCSDGERKEFTYFKEDVAGRIEMAYAAIKPTL